MMSPGSEFWEM